MNTRGAPDSPETNTSCSTPPTGAKAAAPLSWRSTLDLLTTVAILAACVVLLVTLLTKEVPVEPPAIELPATQVSLEGAAQIGDPSGKAVMIIYSDFECPFCKRFANETLPSIIRKYVETGKLRVAYRHLPLRSIHPMALKAAIGGVCAGRQGRFWAWHDVVFRAPGSLNDEVLRSADRESAVDLSVLQDCLNGSDAEATVLADVKTAQVAGIRTTPAFILGEVAGEQVTPKQILVGARPFEAFDTALERLVRGAQIAKAGARSVIHTGG